MLAANETVAEEYFWREIPFLYRTHEAPEEDKVKKLSTFINNFGYHIHMGNEIRPKEIQKLLEKVEGTPQEALISRLALRSMKQARYTPENAGHFGLAAQYYTHFTSPIRSCIYSTFFNFTVSRSASSALRSISLDCVATSCRIFS